MSKWISVEDRLPDIHGEDCSFVCFTNKYGRQEYEFAYRSNHKSTYGEWFTKKGGYGIDNVTHWQPLPAPPEDECYKPNSGKPLDTIIDVLREPYDGHDFASLPAPPEEN